MFKKDEKIITEQVEVLDLSAQSQPEVWFHIKEWDAGRSTPAAAILPSGFLRKLLKSLNRVG